MGKMSRLRQTLRNCIGKPMALQIGGRGTEVVSLIQRLANNQDVGDNDIRAVLTSEASEAVKELAEFLAEPQIVPGPTKGTSIAYVSVRGVATYNMEYQPYCFSTSLLARTMKNLSNNTDIGTILLDIDSPGGMVTGTPEAADAVFAARKKKNVIGLVNPLCASAAYWIASQCTQLIAVPSAEVGSIGAFMLHFNYAKMLEEIGIEPTFIFAGKYKVEGNSYEPLGEEAKVHYQSEVDMIYADFHAAISRGRGVTPDVIEAKFGQGRTMMPEDAKRVKMVDQVMPVEVAMQKCGMSMMDPEEMRRRNRRGDAEEAVATATVEVSSDDDATISAAVDAASSAIASGWDSVLFNSHDENGKRWVTVESPWPQKTRMNPMFIKGFAKVDGDLVTITVANGMAIYKKDGEEPFGDWLCSLVDSKYVPEEHTVVTHLVIDTRAAEESVSALSASVEKIQAAFNRLQSTTDAGAALLANAEVREAAIKARARRLALLKA